MPYPVSYVNILHSTDSIVLEKIATDQKISEVLLQLWTSESSSLNLSFDQYKLLFQMAWSHTDKGHYIPYKGSSG